MRLRTTGDVQRHNEELIEEFLKTRLQLSKPRVLKHRVCLRKVSRHIGLQKRHGG
jgi:hypothetical protein